MATLTGDTFILSNTTLSAGVHYLLSGEPAGTTGIVTTNINGTVATLTLTGNAIDHLDANDIANMTLTFFDAAFTNTLASNIAEYTNNTGVVNFRDPGAASIDYNTDTFHENVLNNGTIGNTMVLTLTGDTDFQDTDADDILDVGTEIIFPNLPVGLTANVALSANDTVATITITGIAAAHTIADNISNLEITFTDSAFRYLPAASVAHSSKADRKITYINSTTGSLTYDTSTFTENVNNNGTISSSIVVTLTGGGTFAPTLTAGSNVIFFNAPTGLAGVISRNSPTQATLTITGNAVAHADINDISNYTVAFDDTAFIGILASSVTGAFKSDIAIDYRDVKLTYDIASFPEVTANDGTITTISTVTLAGDTFSQNTGLFTSGTHYTIANLPAGLSAVVTAASSTTATIELTGSATANLTNPADVTNLTITWLNPAFTLAPATNITNAAKSDFVIDFTNQSSILYAGNFTETSTNDGTLSGTRTATLSGDTFVSSIIDGNVFTPTTHYTVTNLPAGLTAVLTKTSSTIATLTLTGAATSHLNANDLANLTITFVDGVFTNTVLAANVVNFTNNTGAIDFIDVTLAYSGSIFTESSALDGSIGTIVTVTLAGDDFTVPAGLMADATHYTITGIPAGLTAVVTGTSAKTATITLSGTASFHANANDVASGAIIFTFLDAAFNATPASSITNFSKSNFTIDFGDGTIIYTGAGFSENADNNGGVTGTIIATLTGGIWNAALSISDITLGNVPAGLTPILTRTSDTVATLTLTGNATTHTNALDVSDITYVFADTAFDTLTANVVAGATGPASSLLGVNFFDTTLTYGTTTFVENALNNGTIATTSVLTLDNDTWALPSGNFTEGVHYTTNIATVASGLGMTISRTSPTTALVTITGTLTDNLVNPVDVSNLEIVWLDAAFTAVPVSRITGATKSDLILDYTNQAGIIYAGNFIEALSNNGSFIGSRTATVSDDVFTTSVGIGNTFTEATHYTIANLPAGLTPVLTKTSPTVATLTLTGTATDNLTNPVDVTNLTITFLD